MPQLFTPACAPILRGGLPHSSAQAAISLIMATTPELPAWPALPQRSFRESALAQAAAGFPGLTLDAEHERAAVERQAAERGADRLALAYLRGETAAGALPADYSTALTELLRQIDPARRPRALKAEIIGPISLSLLLTDERERPLAYDAAMREALLQHLALRVAWQHQQISAHGEAALICLDEPFLDALSSPLCPLSWEDGAELLDRLIGSAGARCAISTTGAVSWSAVLARPASLVLFDAYEHSAGLIQAAAPAAAFLERGGRIGWGIVPADQAALAQERAETLAGRFERMVEYLATTSGVSLERILAASLITTSGSLTHLSVDVADHALGTCAAVSRLVREKYGLRAATSEK
jgi:hypothetical protein